MELPLNFINSIYLKCVISIGAVLTLLIAGQGVWSYSTEKAQLFQNHDDELEQLSDRLNINLPGLIWNYENSQIDLVLAAEEKLDSVSKIIIYGNDGSILAKSEGVETDNSLEVELSFGQDTQKEPVGKAIIFTDESDINTELQSLFYSELIKDILLLAVLIIVFQIIFTKFVSKPLNKTVLAFKNISSGEGDLTRRLDVVSNDEIGELSQEFNVFVETIQCLVQELNRAVEESAIIAGQFKDDATSSNDYLTSQVSEIDMVAAAITEMSQSAREIVLHVKETVEATDVVNSDTKEVTNVVNRSIDSINSLTEQLDTAASSISMLEKEVENIHSVLDVIVGIAEQTNLLALNAAIEAARAGEQGRGFAVVADEVRALASRTKSSTSEIQKTIESLQSGTRETVQSIEVCQEKCKASVEYAASSGVSISNIQVSSNKINNMAAQIESAVSEQSEVSESLSDNVNKILMTGTHSIEKLEEMLSKSEMLDDSSKTLKKMINQFTV